MKLVTIYIFINYSENLHFYDVYLLGTKKTTGINYNHLRNGKHFAENPTLERLEDYPKEFLLFWDTWDKSS